MRVRGNTPFVTGLTKGIGLGIGRAVAREGTPVVIASLMTGAVAAADGG